jgi:GT2 family glycosyltransferase/glycosyltransferase involved in cell wall biosynthesis
MKKSIIEGMNVVFVAEGNVYAHCDPDQAGSLLETRIGSTATPFVPMDDSPLYDFSFNLNYPLDTSGIETGIVSIPAASDHAKYFACWVNHLTDWAVPGSQTVQLMLTNPDVECQLEIVKPITVTRSAPGMVFETWLAVHRAKCDLRVVFTDEKSRAQTRHTIRFDPDYLGGTERGKYQHVSISFPEGFESGTVGLAIDYLGYVAGAGGIEPFLFLVDTRVGHTAPAPTKSLVQPLLVREGDFELKGTWMCAALPGPVTIGEEIFIKRGKISERLLSADAPQIKLEENYGHSMIISSDAAIEVLLYIDGKAAEQLKFSANNNVVRLPAKYLDGYAHHVCLKDKSGSITLWHSQQLLPAIVTPVEVLQRETVAPFPTALFAQTPLRYASLKASLNSAGTAAEFSQIAYALSVLEGGYDNVKLEPLKFKRPKSPDVSIIIPAFNKVEVTYLALCSLLVAQNDASFEVIVVDDASTDETAKLEEIVSGITVLHNDQSQRFIRACNRGAEAAKGDYIVLLNNDVEVTTGWLDELIAAFGRFDKVGLAGSKLLYPNGELQDAGGIVWSSGNPWNYGNRQNAEDPRFCYARQADYLSGAALMVPAAIWREVGGLSSYMEPMYFEDTDFAFKVREAGYSTWFIPSSVVYHYEGMTSGTDVTSGFKKYQEINRPKFKRRWASAFSSFGKEGQNPDLEKDRGIVGRVLFIDYSTPRPDQDAGSYAALQEIRLVQSLGYKVSFLASNMAHLGSYTQDLQKMGVEMIYAPFYMTQSEYISKHAKDFDAFYITRYYVAQEVLTQLRALAPDARVIFNNADLHFLREIRAAEADGDPARMDKARQTRTDEMEIIRNSDIVLSYNDVEHSVIQAYSEGQAKVAKCPWVVEVPDIRPPLEGRTGLSFLGSYRHHPNADGIEWFIREIMPTAVGRAGPLSLSIYGSGMTAEILGLASKNIHPVGFVKDIKDAFDTHRVFIAPLRSGAGIKGKVLSALAHGIPCVLTPVAAEAIGLRSGHDCFIAETPEQWADAITRLMQDDALWMKISDNAQAYLRDAFSFERGRAHMLAAFEAVELYNAK